MPTVDKPTVIVTDQASIHTSDAIIDKAEKWQQRNISILSRMESKKIPTSRIPSILHKWSKS